MLRQGVNGTALIPVVDPAVLEYAIVASPGQDIHVSLGGKMTRGYCQSLELSATVKAVRPAGTSMMENMGVFHHGRTVLLESGNCKIVILESRDMFINHPGMYESFGIDISKV